MIRLWWWQGGAGSATVSVAISGSSVFAVAGLIFGAADIATAGEEATLEDGSCAVGADGAITGKNAPVLLGSVGTDNSEANARASGQWAISGLKPGRMARY